MLKLKKKWYVIRVISGCEEIVLLFLKKIIKINNVHEFFGKIIIPIENITKIRKGKCFNIKRKFFPGYIFIKMFINNNVFCMIRNIPKVIGFVGGDSFFPLPISDKEIKTVMFHINNNFIKSHLKDKFKCGSLVNIINGPFINFTGTIKEIDYKNNFLKVLILILGKSTIVKLNFNQISKK